jgi:chromosome segregation ATPase
MDSDALRQLFTEFSVEIRRHFDVALEHQSSEIRLLAEGVALANERISRMEEEFRGEFKRVYSEVNGLRADVAGLREEVAELRAEVRGLEAKVGRLEVRVTRVEGSVQDLRSELKAGLTSMRSDLVGFHRRIERLEAAS